MKIKKRFKHSKFAILLLLCLTLLTLSHVNNAKSKYKSETNGTSNATVAKWDVSLTPVTIGNEFDIVTGNTIVDYSIKVLSNSDVSCRYSIIISNVPNDIKVSLDDGTEQTPSNNKVTFSNVGSFIIGDDIEEHTHKISFSAPIESSANNSQINIQVGFTQID